MQLFSIRLCRFGVFRSKRDTKYPAKIAALPELRDIYLAKFTRRVKVIFKAVTHVAFKINIIVEILWVKNERTGSK